MRSLCFFNTVKEKPTKFTRSLKCDNPNPNPSIPRQLSRKRGGRAQAHVLIGQKIRKHDLKKKYRNVKKKLDTNLPL